MNIISQSLWVRNFGWLSWGFPGGSSGKELARQCRRHERLRFNPWVGKTPGGGRAWQPTPVIFAWRIPCTKERSLASYSSSGQHHSKVNRYLSATVIIFT